MPPNPTRLAHVQPHPSRRHAGRRHRVRRERSRERDALLLAAGEPRRRAALIAGEVDGRQSLADALLDLVAETLRNDIAPTLSPELRYAAAMMGNAIDIVRRELAGEAETAEFALLDAVYDDGDGTMQQLAKDIRSRQVSARTHPALPKLLRAQVIAELKVRNPRLLKARNVKG